MKPVDLYIEELDAQLSDVPVERRAEITDETRAHLEAMIEARRVDGMDENAAWQSAKNAFGDAEMVGRELAREWKRAPRVETEGTPLSKREKLVMFARPMLLGALVCGPLTWFSVNSIDENYRGNVFLWIFSLGCFGYGNWRWRRAGGQWSPALIFAQVIGFVQLLWANLFLTFASQLRGTSWEATFQKFPLFMLPLLLISFYWIHRESKSTLAWRQMPGYAQNPIAAEETYRLSPKVGLAMGTTFGCIGHLSMTKFFGLSGALGLCAFSVVFAVIYWRWLDGKAH